MDIPAHHDCYDGPLLLYDERTYGFNDVPTGVPQYERPREDASGPTLDVLDRRYAQGEINREEYEEKKNAITRRN